MCSTPSTLCREGRGVDLRAGQLLLKARLVRNGGRPLAGLGPVVAGRRQPSSDRGPVDPLGRGVPLAGGRC